MWIWLWKFCLGRRCNFFFLDRIYKIYRIFNFFQKLCFFNNPIDLFSSVEFLFLRIKKIKITVNPLQKKSNPKNHVNPVQKNTSA